MIGWSLRRGERLGPVEWIGVLLALGGLIGLTRPGSTAPDPIGAALMCVAGIAWGIYSLRGRGGGDPLIATATNFARAVLPSVAWSLFAVRQMHATPRGVALAAASGALASGLGYSLWYAALRVIPMTRAAVIQLAVPVLAAGGGVVLLDERITIRLLFAGAAILGGVGLAIAGGRWRTAATPTTSR